ncbi:MAG: 3-dehydroquinate synthase [Spartobacteria bacterium]|nr:3-dehydroquinate synthase [Spartobacteria bacterium]
MKIKSYRREYSVDFTDNIVTVLKEQVHARDMLIMDRNVHDLYPELATFVASHRHRLITPSEPAKSYQALTPLIEELIEGGFSKTDRLIGIGGGIIQDITAFTASILFRGVNWLFFPTNLLTQCDSCIGSKTSINFGHYKNQLGGFYPPEKIYLATAMLKTLPERDFRSGIGEMLHYFCVNGREDVDWAKSRVADALNSGTGIDELIHRSLSIKKAMIERDEFDQGPRNVFNYGHSFGHAIESATHFEVPHGIAVSFGMDMANQISVKLGLIDASLQQELHELFAPVWQGTSLEPMDFDEFLSALKKDKKNEGTQIKVILTKGLGQMFKTTLTLDDEMLTLMKTVIRKT